MNTGGGKLLYYCVEKKTSGERKRRGSEEIKVGAMRQLGAVDGDESQNEKAADWECQGKGQPPLQQPPLMNYRKWWPG